MTPFSPEAPVWRWRVAAGAVTALEDGEAGMPAPRRTIAIACVLGAIVLVVLDATLANVALPSIAASLRVAPGAALRVVTAYQIALVMTLLPCAVLGERLGYRLVYTAGVALFVGASALCALSPSLSLLVVARFIQGLGGAAIMSLGVALLRFVMPKRQLGAAIAWNTLAVALASAAGPTLGALVLSNAGWQWLFTASLPFGALVLLATRALPRVPGSARELDALSMALNAAAFAGFAIGAGLMPERGLLATVVLGAAALAMLALIRREVARPFPMIPLDLLRRGSFRSSVLASICCFVGQSAAMVSLPFYLQHRFEQSVLQTGLSMTPWPLTVALVAPVAGRLANRISGAWLCALGGTMLALGLGAAAVWPLPGRPTLLVPFVALAGAGFGLFQVSNNRNLFLSAPRSRSAAAGGLQSMARLVGQTAGALMMTALFTTTPIERAPRMGLGLAALLTLAAGLISLLRVGVPADLAARESGRPE
jgi:MFS transporter, DHA2 family, multidrug resistance protein